MSQRQVCAILGLGVAGTHLADALRDHHSDAQLGLVGFDPALANPTQRPRLEGLAQDQSMVLCESLADTVAQADIVFSLVPGTVAISTANACAASMRSGSIFVDLNSITGEMVAEMAPALDQAGVELVDGAVLGNFEGGGRMPIVLCGGKADAINVLLPDDRFLTDIVAGKPGDASTLKMLRSVMLKGLEVLAVECLVAAEAKGVGDTIFEVFKDLEQPFIDKMKVLTRTHLVHGERRMKEVERVQTVLAGENIDGVMTDATHRFFKRTVDAKVRPADGSLPDLESAVKALLSVSKIPEKEEDKPGIAPCWIESKAPDDPDIKDAYDELRRHNGRDYNLYRASSLRPDPILAADAQYRATLHDERNALPQSVLEMVSTQVAILADCHYATQNHGRNFIKLSGDDEVAKERFQAMLRHDWENSLFDLREQALLKHGEKLALRPDLMRESDIDRLRDAGLKDVEILEATQAMAGFAYWSRYINGLGIKLADEQIGRKGI